MQADSSANRTCNESRSTSLCTATVPMPISLHVQMMRQAISPRFATRILRKRRCGVLIKSKSQSQQSQSEVGPWTLDFGLALLYSEKRLAVFDGLTVFNVNLDDFARGLSLNLVHQFHGFDDTDDRISFDIAADAHEAVGVWRRRAIERSHDRRG